MRKFTAFLFTIVFMGTLKVLGVTFDGHFERGLFYMVAWLVGYQLSDKLEE